MPIIRSFPVSLPPLVTQKRIASVLSVFDDKIEVNNRINAKLEEMAQAIFKEWFSVPASESELPEGWSQKRLGEIIDLKYGKALKETERAGGNVAVVGSSGIVGWHDTVFVNGPGIVVGRKGSTGTILWIDYDFYPIDTTFYVETNLPLTFCYYLLKRQDFHGGDSAVPGLNRDMALQNTVIIPDDEKMKKFDETVAPMFQKLYKAKDENQKLAEARDALLSKLMSGEVEV